MKTTTSFDSAGRLGTVARENGDIWTYGYTSGSSRIHTVGFSGSGATAHTAVREYDSLGRVKSIRYQRGNSSATWASNRLLGWTYGYKATSPYQRETAEPYAPTGSTAGADEPPGWTYAYNLRGEVTGAVRSDRAGAVAGQEWGYSYDAIGNRLAATRGSSPGPVRTTTYTSNSTNACTQIAGPGAVEISGMTAAGVARVAVNGLPASGRPAGNGEPYGFSQWLTGQSGTSWLTVAVEATRPGEPPTNVPMEMLQEGRVWVPGTVTPQMDADGNLLFDGRWTYTWDGENRLIAMETAAAVSTMVGAPLKKRLEFAYDGQSRRLGKVVKQWQAAAQQWVVTGHWTYLHDGWNLVAELDALRGGALVRTYTWGTDLSGSGQGAGGVGGLLGVQVHHGVVGRYSVCTEVNGNVMGLVEATSGQVAGRFDYDAFGDRITDAGVGSAVCPIGFSTKYTDAETGLCYYGYRYYDAVRGRWINRDPIEEEGGVNIYQFCKNDATSHIDYSGLKTLKFVLGYDKTFTQADGSFVARYKQNMAKIIKKCIAKGKAQRSFPIFGKLKPPCCPNLDLVALEELVVEIKVGKHFAEKGSHGAIWGNPLTSNGPYSSADDSTEKLLVEDLRSSYPGYYAVLLTKSEIYKMPTTNSPGDRALAHASRNNTHFLINVQGANEWTFPHEFGHVMDWKSEEGTPHSFNDPKNLMGISGGPEPDCRYCQLLLTHAD